MVQLDAKKIILNFGTGLMTACWLRVLIVFMEHSWNEIAAGSPDGQNVCQHIFQPRIHLALAFSFIDLFNSILGLTRSKPSQVLLFASVRTGVELLVAPKLPCGAWQHLATVLCWSLGDFIRCGCFFIDGLMSSPNGSGFNIIKSVRYTVGPILFPIGTLCEMFLVARVAMDGRPSLFAALALWPAGFYPLMKQLLKQRKKHFQQKPSMPVKKMV